MGARTGEQYLAGLRDHPREVWIHGERVQGDITRHPAFRNVTRSVAALYELQSDPELEHEMTYVSPSSGDRVGLSFLQPRSRDDIIRRREMMQRWANYSGGMMGRSPDYLNSGLMAMAAAAEFFAKNDPRHADNIRHYYEHVREHDLCLSHTLITPQVNRSLGPSQQADPFIVARVVKESDDGLVVRGARLLATLGPIADEIEVFPSTVLRGGPEDKPYTFAFSIPCDTPGLKFICRESFDYGKTPFDHPLGARFEEMDAVVVFDDVLVPWERVFLYGDVELANGVFSETNAVIHMAYQVIVKNLAKAEFILGIAASIADRIGIDQFQHVQEKLSEIIVTVEMMRAFLRASEADAAVDRWGLMTPAWGPLNAARNLFPKLYPRLVEIIQQLGASGLMAIPTEEDMRSPIRPLIDRYLQGRNVDAYERVRLFRLAWDVALSAFGSRQVLYERFFFGDPVRMASALYTGYDKEPYKQRIQEFLEAVTAQDPTARYQSGD
ncbi:MAG TPA: 4-hydroxyphenylacetate 3-monooxygenase, oxygenase component [Thermomicrobiaceae bacterium]|nr:4-hydroxyphenylacetate 3-monooxygenase, oxygenase component [Thermomicrobiaceae bacterium]